MKLFNFYHTTQKLKLLIMLVVLIHAIFSVAYNFIIPLGYGPDEPHHYGYVQHLVLYRSLPKLGPATHPYLCHRDPRPPNAIGIHPPLYYSLLAPIYYLLADRSIDFTPPATEKLPFKLLHYERSKLVQRLFRLISLVISLITLWFVWSITFSALKDAELSFAVFAFVALLPHYLMLSAVINNDSMTILTAHAFLLLLIRVMSGALNPLVGSALLGISCGLMFLSKASLLSLAPLQIVGALSCMRRTGVGAQRMICLALSLLLPIAISGWWYLRFYILNGRLMPIVKWVYEPCMLLNSPFEFLTDGRSWHLLWRFIKGAHRSLWAQVDWFIFKPEHGERWSQFYGSPNPAFYPISEGLYSFLVLLTILALLGLLFRFATWLYNGGGWKHHHSLQIVVAMPFVLLYLALLHYTLFTHPGGYEGGRYLMPSICSFGIIFWCGIGSLIGVRYRKVAIACITLLLVTLNALCIGNLVTFLNPIYAPPL
ncbi:MAG: hypothetical protein RMK18_07740 [Armatimonadota bacterium]|nr:hypothetical protein [Armatimonadota bacterium]MCX7776651.1 hypothetical protein [Armatimonadota bacterium]MDW8025735.1 hypothetical protein [Armatimonadota bacterium]